ncbi:MAG: ThiF family adenylyltransferase [Candidatus Paceibacterota bacterium]
MPLPQKSSQNNFTPVFLEDEKEIQTLLLKNPHIVLIDAFSHQLKELFVIENPIYAGERKIEGFQTEKFKEFCDQHKNNFTHVYYSWNHSIVKTVKKEAYLKLKTNRNQDLITAAEQEKLSQCRVGVFGMSVGSNIALVLTQAGISNDIIIADFDELDTTNLNRIIAGSHQIGLNKCIISARHIYEDNPFANVTAWQDGINESNLEEALKLKKIDIIVEEVDNLAIKIKTRELAQKYKIPVVMITDNGDGAMLHIERYDLGYNKIFNKSFEYWRELFQTKPSMEDIGKVIIGDVLGGPQNVSPRVFASVERIMKHELVSWAQLGSAAVLGGVVTTIAIKNIVSGKDTAPYVEKNIQIEF